MEKVKLPEWVCNELDDIDEYYQANSPHCVFKQLINACLTTIDMNEWIDQDDNIFKLADALRYGYEVDEAKEIPDFVKETAKKNAIYIHTKEKLTEVVGRGGALLILDCQYGLKSEDQIKQEKESNDKFNQWMSEDENNHIIYADLIDKYTEEIE